MKLRVLLFKCILFICFIICKYTEGQDPSFSQFYNNALYYNPAFAGCLSGTRIALSSRMQYTNVDNNNLWKSFNTEKVSVDFNFGTRSDIINGIGLMLTSDQEGGFLTTTKLGIPLTFIVPLKINKKKNKIIFFQVGVAASVLFSSVNWSDMVFTEQLDPIYGNVNGTSFQFPENNIKPKLDFDFGAVMNYDFNGKGGNSKLLLGFAVHHLTQPNRSLMGFEYKTSKLPIKHSVFAQCFFVFRKNNLAFDPLFVYETQAKMHTFLFGGNFRWKAYSIGLYNRTYNNSDALIICLSSLFNVKNYGKRQQSYIISYSYDITVSGLSNRSGGSHEISLILGIDRSLSEYFKKGKKSSRKKPPCPMF